MNPFPVIKPLLHLFFYCIISGILISCSQPGRKKTPEIKPAEQKVTGREKPPSGSSDTLIIHFPSAVFFAADSIQWEKLKGMTDKNEYESEVHDCYFQMRNSRIVLKQYWPEINIIEATSYRYLLFIKEDKSSELIDLDSRGDMCGVYLFDGKKEPEFADMMNIDTALRFYFSK